MIIDFQQGIISYPVSGSLQQFLQFDAGYVTLNADNGPTDITFAHGVENYLVTESSTVPNAWGPISNSVPTWIYWDLNTRSAVRTFGATTIQPVYSANPPVDAVSGQHWFDTTTKRMKIYNSTSGMWGVVIRVFAAKVTNGNILPLGSSSSKPFAGTQVGINIPSVAAGRIIMDDVGMPIRRSTGEFFTLEHEFFVDGSPVNAIRLESVVVNVTAQETMAHHQIVKYTDFGEVHLAVYNDVQTTIIAMITEDILLTHTGTACIQGVITNPNWDWQEVGIPLWVHGTIPGYLTEVDPHVTDPVAHPEAKPPVARVLAQHSVYFDQGLGGYGAVYNMGGGGILEIPDIYVFRAGDTMTGNLGLPPTQTLSNQATTKGYVDSRVLDNLVDVIITSPAEDEVLLYDGTHWINAPLDIPPPVSTVGLRQVFVATEGQTVYTGLVHPYVVGGGQLTVYINGIQQYPNSITETSTTSFTLSAPVQANDRIMAEISTITPPYIQPPTISATGYKQKYTATGGQTTFTGLTNHYVVGGGQLSVYINGVMQYPDTITELSTSSFSVGEPSEAGDVVLAVISDITPPYIYPPAIATMSLDELTDVVITAPALNNTLVYNGALWVNQAGGGGDDIVSVFRVGVPGAEANHSHFIGMTRAQAESLITLAVPTVNITSTTQSGHNHIVTIGYDAPTYKWTITNISNNTLDNHWCIEISSNIEALTGVTITTPVQNQILEYHEHVEPLIHPTPGVWENVTPWWMRPAQEIVVIDIP